MRVRRQQVCCVGMSQRIAEAVGPEDGCRGVQPSADSRRRQNAVHRAGLAPPAGDDGGARLQADGFLCTQRHGQQLLKAHTIARAPTPYNRK